MYVKIDNQAENLAGEKKIADYDAQKVMHISARHEPRARMVLALIAKSAVVRLTYLCTVGPIQI